MVLFLNYLPWLILAIGVYAFWKSFTLPIEHPKRTKYIFRSVFATIFLFVLLQGLTAGYIPKQRSSPVGIGMPAFEPSTTQIEDRLRKPERLGEESATRFNEMTDWRESVKQGVDTKSEKADNADIN